jgi:hypothetical protein
MRSALAVALLIAFSGTVAAQSRGDRSADELPRPSIGLPLPQIGLPLPPIGLPLVPMGVSPRTSERPERAVFLYVPAFGWPYPYLPGTAAPSLPTPPEPPRRATGRLHLDLPSAIDPQIYVDGYYVGLASDVGSELTLDTGMHAIEFREDGYENLHVDVQIAADGLVTYRGELKRLAPSPLPVAQAPSSPVEPPAPTTIYVIPGCYVGNVPPKDATLPAGCDPNRAIAFPSRP